MTLSIANKSKGNSMVNLISGTAHTGKTILLLHLLREALFRGEKAVVILSDEPQTFLDSSEHNLDFSLLPALESGQLSLFQFGDHMEYMLHSQSSVRQLLEDLGMVVRERRARFLAFDTIDPLLSGNSPAVVKPIVRMFLEFVRGLKVASFITVMGELEGLGVPLEVQELSFNCDLLLSLRRQGAVRSISISDSITERAASKQYKVTYTSSGEMLLEENPHFRPGVLRRRGTLAGSAGDAKNPGPVAPVVSQEISPPTDPYTSQDELPATPPPLPSSHTQQPSRIPKILSERLRNTMKSTLMPILILSIFHLFSACHPLWESPEEHSAAFHKRSNGIGEHSELIRQPTTSSADHYYERRRPLSTAYTDNDIQGVAHGQEQYPLPPSPSRQDLKPHPGADGANSAHLRKLIAIKRPGEASADSGEKAGGDSGGETRSGDIPLTCNMERAYTLVIDGRAEEAEQCYKSLLAQRPEDEQRYRMVLFALISLLWSSGDTNKHREAIVLLSAHLRRNPGDGEALLTRARIGSSLHGKRWHERAIADYREYLSIHGEGPDKEVTLELAALLSWSGDPDYRIEAEGIYSSLIALDPENDHLRLLRGRVRLWSGNYPEAVEDLRNYLTRNDDRDVRQELARALTGARQFDAAEEEYARLDAESSLSGRVLFNRGVTRLWAQDYPAAEAILMKVRDDTENPELADEANLELARLYSYSGRKLEAMALLDVLSVRRPDMGAAVEQKELVRNSWNSNLTPYLNVFSDKNGTYREVAGVGGEVVVSPTMSLLVDVASFQHNREGLSVSSRHLDFGAELRPADRYALQFTGGPRFSTANRMRMGGRAAARVNIAPQWSVNASVAVDELSHWMSYPEAVEEGINGTEILGSVFGTPGGVETWARLGTKLLSDDNRATELLASATIPITSHLRGGYAGHYLGWTDESPLYWSPSSYSSHQAILRAEQSSVEGEGVRWHAQVGVGLSSEKTGDGADTGWNMAWSGRTGLSLPLSESTSLGSNAMMGASERQADRYWWLAGNVLFQWNY